MINWFRMCHLNRFINVIGLFYDRWVHAKRRSTYRRLNEAGVQASTRPLVEGDVVTVYECERSGHWYVRLSEEFHDGRFERTPE